MERKELAIICVCVIIILSLFILFCSVNNSESLLTSASAVSNKKNSWGIKRNNNHNQPDVGAENKRIIEKYNGICIGNSEKPYIYLTFDSGYEAGYTKKILEVLKKNQVPATFFVTAHYVNSEPDLIKQMIDEGHIIGNHTANHKSMPEISNEQIKEEVMNLHSSLYEKFGYEMKYMRPPKGEFSERTLSITDSLGFKTVMWSFAYVDWNDDKQPSKEDAMKKIISNLHNGEIMLLHATSKTNSEIMGEMVDKIKEEGYEIKSLEEFR